MSRCCAAAWFSCATPASIEGAVTSFALMTTSSDEVSDGNAACRRLNVCTTGWSCGSDAEVFGVPMSIPRAGIARATSRPVARLADSSGRRSTRSTMRDQMPMRATRLRSRPRPGIRPFSMRSPSIESTAGSTVSEPSMATATTTMVPVANEVNVAAPAKYMPAMAIMTVMPETSTARPEVAAAASIAASLLRPAARSSRTRRR